MINVGYLKPTWVGKTAANIGFVASRTNKTPEQCTAITKYQGVGSGATRPLEDQRVYFLRNMIRCHKMDKYGKTKFLSHPDLLSLAAPPSHLQHIDEDVSSFATVDRLVFALRLHYKTAEGLGAFCITCRRSERTSFLQLFVFAITKQLGGAQPAPVLQNVDENQNTQLLATL